MSKTCFKCTKLVYPLEELKCLDKIWHKNCFKCHECNMLLNMKNYKGYDKTPYCSAHYPKAKATSVAETPELTRVSNNTKIQSQIKYHEEFDKKIKGTVIQVADDPETLRATKVSSMISQLEYKRDSRRESLPAEESETQYATRYAYAEADNLHPRATRPTSNSTSYSSVGKANITQKVTRIGSIADYDPVNERYGSLGHGYKPASRQSSVTTELSQISDPVIIDESSSFVGMVDNEKQELQCNKDLEDKTKPTHSHLDKNDNKSEGIDKLNHSFPDVIPINHITIEAKEHNSESIVKSNQSSNFKDSLALNSNGMQSDEATDAIVNHVVAPSITADFSQEEVECVNGDEASNCLNVDSSIEEQDYFKSANHARTHLNASQSNDAVEVEASNHIVASSNNGQSDESVYDEASNHISAYSNNSQSDASHEFKPANHNSALLNIDNLEEPVMHDQNGHIKEELATDAVTKDDVLKKVTSNKEDDNDDDAMPVTTPLPGVVFVAVFEYAAQDEDEVDLEEGDRVINCEQIDEGWMIGMVERTGARGMLPSNYVERV